jgi:choice-of-anchor A domain-containing protein
MKKTITLFVLIAMIMTLIPIGSNIFAQDIEECGFLGIAGQFNAMIFNDMYMVKTDSEGRLAVGGHAYLNPASVGQSVVFDPDVAPYSLVIGRSAELIGGGIKNGLIGANYGALLQLPKSFQVNGTDLNNQDPNEEGYPVCFAEDDPIIDFALAKTELMGKSISLFNVNQTDDYRFDESALNFSSSNTEIAIFKITSDEIEKANIIYIDVPTSATVVINVIGEELTLANKAIKLKQDGIEQSDDQIKSFSDKILWNMPYINQLNIGSFGMYGSVLMPEGDFVCIGWGQINGTLVANNYYSGSPYVLTDIPSTVNGAIELHNHLFEGVIDTSPEQPDATPTPEVTPAPTPEPTPDPIPDPDQDSDDQTPDATPTPDPNQDSDDQTPDATPTPEVTPAPTPEPTPDPTPTIDPDNEETPLNDADDESSNEQLEDKITVGIEEQSQNSNASENKEDKQQDNSEQIDSLPTIDFDIGRIPLTNIEVISNPDLDELQSEEEPLPTITVVGEQIPQTGENTNHENTGFLMLAMAAGTAILLYGIINISRQKSGHKI